MPTFTFSESKHLPRHDLVGLYSSVGWTAYASDPDALVRAVEQSSYVLTASNEDGELVGLARVISDNATICYLQDILVSPRQQRAGLGKALVEKVLERYVHVRQKVLLTDDEPGQRAFYESLGFIEGSDFSPTPLRTFVQIGG
ncbi:Acetyltransferase (GNAT) domain-containing protein [Cryobacterium flavum]|uniref:Acetyltransferase (GNAT) domain-containing protein n=2 Tax=Cryobacterium TaxID=69578 RepID=A0A4R8V6D0_9MICO|nr:GNAT family N-acetyltransferase [Cryobacterium flavum]TFB78093.1 N-acetyltransferase [Cryobacterium flavum]SDO52390.1 Acetyltransferase (GNAT) domain-containing protein [Cryobacterium flavum]